MIKGMTNLKYWRTCGGGTFGNGITQIELSKRSGVSLRTLQEYEQGRKPINGAAALTVLRIAKELNVTVEDLLELD